MKKQNSKADQSLPPIPSKRFFSIREAAKLCGIPSHVLRYWEAEFKKLKPAKNSGGHRRYTNKDIELVRDIRHLLYDQGFTIAGAKQQLKSGSKAQTVTQLPDQEPQSQKTIEQDTTKDIGKFISQMVTDLETLLSAAEVGGT
ncbi:MAG: MerR family transcriptional regulator [Gammaproteobacteria bacterium]